MKNLLKKWSRLSLVKQIIVGLIIGIILALTIPEVAKPVVIFGSLFVGALKAIAPVVVLFLVMSAIAQHKNGQKTNMKTVLILYLLGTFLAGLIAVIVSFIFPVDLTLTKGAEGVNPPKNVVEVLKTLLLNVVDNPVKAISNANYIGILTWAVLLGLALRNAADSTKTMIANVSDAVSKLVTWVIKLAPLGIMGLVFESITTSGLDALLSYGKLLAILIGCMLFVAFVVNPIIVYVVIKQNPFP